MHDIIVIGAGPAGLAAIAQVAQHHLRTMVIAPDQAGKAAYRLRLPWLQEHEFILGQETVEHLRSSMITAPLVERRMDLVEHVFVHNGVFQVGTADGGAFLGRAVHRRSLRARRDRHAPMVRPAARCCGHVEVA